MRSRPRQRGWVRHVLGVVGLLVIYYAVPTGALGISGRTVLSLFLTILGVTILAIAITGQVRRQLALDPEARVQSLVMLLELVVVVFAAGYYVLEFSTPGQMADLHTRTDSLYFTLSTLTTIGFGDVHAVGQVARVLVIIQMVFDVVFVAAVAATLRGRIRTRFHQ
jgi:voltage-gated potassium channel